MPSRLAGLVPRNISTGSGRPTVEGIRRGQNRPPDAIVERAEQSVGRSIVAPDIKPSTSRSTEWVAPQRSDLDCGGSYSVRGRRNAFRPGDVAASGVLFSGIKIPKLDWLLAAPFRTRLRAVSSIERVVERPRPDTDVVVCACSGDDGEQLVRVGGLDAPTDYLTCTEAVALARALSSAVNEFRAADRSKPRC